MLDQLCAFLHMNKSICRSNAASVPGSLPLHANALRLVGSISSRLTSFLCGYRKLSTHSEPGGMVLVRTAQEAGSKAIPPHLEPTVTARPSMTSQACQRQGD